MDVKVFQPYADPAGARRLRDRLGVQDRRVVLCVSRLVAREGQDVLIRALPLVQRRCPKRCWCWSGRGPEERRLRALARRCADGSVVFAGGVDHVGTAKY